jgi:putative sterol carrier protein
MVATAAGSLQMSLDTITDAVRTKLRENPPFGHTILFDFGADGLVFVDGTQSPAVVTNERQEAETTLTLSPSLFEGMLRGESSATLAYMTGQLKINGSIGVALKLNALLEE